MLKPKFPTRRPGRLFTAKQVARFKQNKMAMQRLVWGRNTFFRWINNTFPKGDPKIMQAKLFVDRWLEKKHELPSIITMVNEFPELDLNWKGLRR